MISYPVHLSSTTIKVIIDFLLIFKAFFLSSLLVNIKLIEVLLRLFFNKIRIVIASLFPLILETIPVHFTFSPS